MASRSFGTKVPQKIHLVRGTGGLQGEIADLRADTEEAFLSMEADTGGGQGIAQANIRLNTQPTAADTITIGSNVYEFKALITDAPTTPGNIVVLRGASAAAALANIIAAINGASGLGTTYSAKGTALVKASIYNTDFLHIEAAEAAGGAVVPGLKPNIAISDALTASIAWDHENLGRTGGDVALKKVVHQIVVDAVNLAANFDVVAPGVITKAEVLYVTNAAGVVDTTGKGASAVLTIVPARNAVTVDFHTGGTDPVATDKVYLQITYV